MDRNILSRVIMGVLGIAVVLLFIWTRSVEKENGELRDSLARMNAVLDSVRSQTPGLGERMSAVQLHTSKLWFAGQARNWKLVAYEVHELEEAVEAAEALRVRKNNVDITPVLQSLRQTQLPLFEQAAEKSDPRAFTDAYNQTIEACNGCHRASGYEFIHIITPTREPVTNQQWQMGGHP